MSQPRILSGVQPTGNLHLGNYLGAIRNWVQLQTQYDCYFMLADLHAITVPQDPARLRANVRETAAAYIACGIDPAKSAIFHQSAIAGHSELAWIFSCHAPLGWLNRMTQFKEKTGSSKLSMRDLKPKLKKQIKQIDSFLKAAHLYNFKIGKDLTETEQADFFDSTLNLVTVSQQAIEETILCLEDFGENFEGAKLGLYSYPVLMAADILLYKATHVPVGEDQKQHLELTRDVAGAFNRAYPPSVPPASGGDEKGGIFPIPEPLILGEATRVMSLRDGTKKMSKSDESDYSRINLTDDADAIALKFRKAKSDMLDGITDEPGRPEAANLLAIYAALQGVSKAAALEEVGGMQFSAFKQRLTEVAVAHLSPITARMRELLDAPDYIDEILAAGVEKARAVADETLKEVKEVVGFLV